jgi:hypothetical protein
LIRRFVARADASILGAGGIVGKHVATASPRSS